MNRYTFSRKGKIKDIRTNILFYGIIIAVSIFISRFGKLYYVTWIPILWALFSLFLKVYLTITTTFFVNEIGLGTSVDTLTGSNINARISWEEIKKIKITRQKSKITAVDIYTKSKDRDLSLWDSIENFDELVTEILNKAKNFSGIEIKEVT